MRGTPPPNAPAPRRPPVRLSRLAVRRSACIGGIALVGLFGWAMYLATVARESERASTAAAHASAVRLVRLAMELQAELDAQECAPKPHIVYPIDSDLSCHSCLRFAGIMTGGRCSSTCAWSARRCQSCSVTSTPPLLAVLIARARVRTRPSVPLARTHTLEASLQRQALLVIVGIARVMSIGCLAYV